MSRRTTASTSRRRRPVCWIKGNNEDFDVVAAAAAGHSPAPTLHYLPNGGPHLVGPWRVAALGGTFAPSWYHTPAAALPPRVAERRPGPLSSSVRVATTSVVISSETRSWRARRFETSTCSSHTKRRARFILPASGSTPERPVINEVLTSLRPRLHLFGHHHEFTDSMRQGVRSIGLDIVTTSYLLVDAATFRCERIET